MIKSCKVEISQSVCTNWQFDQVVKCKVILPKRSSLSQKLRLSRKMALIERKQTFADLFENPLPNYYMPKKKRNY